MPARNDAEVPITVGVDTHLDLHVAVTLDHLGRLDDLTVPTDGGRLREAPEVGRGPGEPGKGRDRGSSGSFGAGLARYLREKGVEVLEVGCPKRRDQHRSGKSDPMIGAELAARAVEGRARRHRHRRGEGLGGDRRNEPGAAGRPPIRGEGACPGGEAALTRRCSSQPRRG